MGGGGVRTGRERKLRGLRAWYAKLKLKLRCREIGFFEKNKEEEEVEEEWFSKNESNEYYAPH